MFNFFDKNNYSIGNQYFDNENEKIFNVFENLYESILQSKANNIVAGLLDELSIYANHHFKDEEQLMEKYSYPWLKITKHEHAQFKETIDKYKLDLADGKLFISMKLMNFLEKWIYNHILYYDKDFIEHYYPQNSQNKIELQDINN